MTETPELTIYEKAFAKTDKTDAILVVDGKKLHVNKALLSYHSDYFKTLFNSNFVEKSIEEIPIEDVKFEDFAILLSLVHEKPLKITKPSVENLLELADRFLMQNPKYIVESIVKISDKFTQMEKLMLADKYKLDDLLEFAIKSYTSKESFRDFYFDWNRNFSDSSKAKLFDYFFKFYGNSC
ncbi:hypothetical protein CAEBREN_19056 [Caenorhabditis brenneri]|uniref:BTB domain-containing protein n=1 Tax=Caenorhabditis brenneri TaxID=135651 RepID=G0MVY4_CAEBE|nr:hypothetical protein CAEBREN_19056 [Caenorhabditis brenneri]